MLSKLELSRIPVLCLKLTMFSLTFAVSLALTRISLAKGFPDRAKVEEHLETYLNNTKDSIYFCYRPLASSSIEERGQIFSNEVSGSQNNVTESGDHTNLWIASLSKLYLTHWSLSILGGEYNGLGDQYSENLLPDQFWIQEGPTEAFDYKFKTWFRIGQEKSKLIIEIRGGRNPYLTYKEIYQSVAELLEKNSNTLKKPIYSVEIRYDRNFFYHSKTFSPLKDFGGAVSYKSFKYLVFHDYNLNWTLKDIVKKTTERILKVYLSPKSIKTKRLDIAYDRDLDFPLEHTSPKSISEYLRYMNAKSSNPMAEMLRRSMGSFEAYNYHFIRLGIAPSFPTPQSAKSYSPELALVSGSGAKRIEITKGIEFMGGIDKVSGLGFAPQASCRVTINMMVSLNEMANDFAANGNNYPKFYDRFTDFYNGKIHLNALWVRNLRDLDRDFKSTIFHKTPYLFLENNHHEDATFRNKEERNAYSERYSIFDQDDLVWGKTGTFSQWLAFAGYIPFQKLNSEQTLNLPFVVIRTRNRAFNKSRASKAYYRKAFNKVQNELVQHINELDWTVLTKEDLN